MWFLLCVLLLPYNCICETLVNTNTEDALRNSRHVDFSDPDCCPCPKAANSEPGASDDADVSRVDADNLADSSVPRMVESVTAGPNVGCPCAVGEDLGSSATDCVRNGVLSARPLLRTADSEIDPKQLLHPEVGFASSVLETLKDVTEEELNEALSRENERNAAEAIVPTVDDGDSADSSIENVGTDTAPTIIIVQPIDPLIGSDPKAEGSHIQEVECITPELEKSSNDAIGLPSAVTESYVKPERPSLKSLLPTFPKLDGILKRNPMQRPSFADNLTKSIAGTNSANKSSGLTGINNEIRSILSKLKPLEITRNSLTPNKAESVMVPENVEMKNEKDNSTQAHLLSLLSHDLQKQITKLVEMSKILNLRSHSKTDTFYKTELSENTTKPETRLDAIKFVDMQESENSVSKSDKVPVSLKITTDTLNESQVAETNNQCVAKTDEMDTNIERSQALEDNEPSNSDNIDKITSTSSEVDDNENIATTQRSDDVIIPTGKLHIEENEVDNESLDSDENFGTNVRDKSKNHQVRSSHELETGFANLNSGEANDDEHSNEHINIPSKRGHTMNSGQENDDTEVAETNEASINSCSVTSDNKQDKSLEEINNDGLPAASTSVVDVKKDKASEVESPVKENHLSKVLNKLLRDSGLLNIRPKLTKKLEIKPHKSNLQSQDVDSNVLVNTMGKTTETKSENEKISHNTLQNMSDSLLVSSLPKEPQLNSIDCIEDVNNEQVKKTLDDEQNDSLEIVTENTNSVRHSNLSGISNLSTEKKIDKPRESESKPNTKKNFTKNFTFKNTDDINADSSLESDGFKEAPNVTNDTDNVASSTQDNIQDKRTDFIINRQNSLPTIDDNVDSEDKSLLPECLNEPINESVLAQNNKSTSMTAEASAPLTNIITHPNPLFRHLGSPLIVQPDLIINDFRNGLARGTPIPLSDLMQTNIQLPSIDELTSRITDVLNLPSNSNSPLGQLGSIPDIIPKSSNILNSPLGSYPLVKPPKLGSSKINILRDILEKPLKGIDLDVIQVKPTILGRPIEQKTKNVGLNINSFVEQLKVKPMKIDPVVGNNGRLLNHQPDSLNQGTKLSKNTMIDRISTKVNNMKSQDSLLGSLKNKFESNKRVNVNTKKFRVPNLNAPNSSFSKNKSIAKSESNNIPILKAPLQVDDLKTLKQIRDDFNKYMESPLNMLNQLRSEILQSIPKTTIPSLDSLSRAASSSSSVLKSPQLNHSLRKMTTSNEKLASGQRKVLKKSQIKPIDKTTLENMNIPDILSNLLQTQDKQLLNKKIKSNKFTEPLKIRLPLRHGNPNMIMSASGPKEEIMKSTKPVQQRPIKINQKSRFTTQNSPKNRNTMSKGDNSIESLSTILARVSSSLNKNNVMKPKKKKKIFETTKSDINSNSNNMKPKATKLRNNEPALGKIKNVPNNVKKGHRINNNQRVPLDGNIEATIQDEVVINHFNSTAPKDSIASEDNNKKDAGTDFKTRQVNISKTSKPQLSIIESPLLAKLKEVIATTRANILKPTQIKQLTFKKPDAKANDMSNAATDSVVSSVSIDEPMKENVSYKCKFMCNKD